MKTIDPKLVTFPEVQRLLQGGVAPRPIALVSTLSPEGIPNLSPFSFFNVFGANPPIVAFSPSRKGRDATLKDTYNNLMATGECVIHSVSYEMVQQISLASSEFEPEVDEFIKAGFTRIESVMVKPFAVKESAFRMECKLLKMESFGEGGAAANIAICEVILFDVAEDIFHDGLIIPDKIDLVARMSGDFYSRASGDAVFEVEKPAGKRCIGFDNLPKFMLDSHSYSGNELGAFANSTGVPDVSENKQILLAITSKELSGFENDASAFNRYLRRGEIEKVVKLLFKNDEMMSLPTIQKIKNFEKSAKLALNLNRLDLAWALALEAGKL